MEMVFKWLEVRRPKTEAIANLRLGPIKGEFMK